MPQRTDEATSMPESSEVSLDLCCFHYLLYCAGVKDSRRHKHTEIYWHTGSGAHYQFIQIGAPASVPVTSSQMMLTMQFQCPLSEPRIQGHRPTLLPVIRFIQPRITESLWPVGQLPSLFSDVKEPGLLWEASFREQVVLGCRRSKLPAGAPALASFSDGLQSVSWHKPFLPLSCFWSECFDHSSRK